jgi:hypothetical protein
MKKKTPGEDRRAFLGKVASISIATAFGGLTAVSAQSEKSGFKITKKGKKPNPKKPEGSDLEQGDLAKIAKVFNHHPDVAVRALLKQTAMGLASKEDTRKEFGKDVRGALKKLDIEVPPGLLPKSLKIPPGVLEAAKKRKGWGIGAGHSNRNYWSYHSNHHRYSDYTDWW